MAIAPDQAPDEHLTGFLLPQHGVRGAILRAHAGVARMLASAGEGKAGVRDSLGALLAAAPLMAAHLKQSGRLSLQIQEAAAWSLLLVQVQIAASDRSLQLRGMVRPEAAATAESGFAALCAGGRFAVTFEQSGGGAAGRYQALVDVDADTAAATLERYYGQSEQLPTRVCLAAGEEGVAGLMLQRLPGADGADDGWAHAEALMDTVASGELLATRPATMLHRLFHADDLVLHEPRPLHVACSCSQARISRMLLSLGAEEVSSIVAEQGQVEVRCEFCGAEYRYDPAQVAALFAADRDDSDSPPPEERH